MRSGKIACFILCLGFAGNAAADDSAAMDKIAASLKNGDFSVVQTKLVQLADAGNDRAQFNLAVSYAHGNGVNKNPQEAFKWYEKAAKQGNTRAELNLANAYLEGAGTEKNTKEAVKWYEAAAVDGDAIANLALGNIYSRGGDDVAPDQAKAFKYYQAAADKNNAEAQFNLAGMYLFGVGVSKDASKAISVYNKLAVSGDSRSAMVLGEIYESDKYIKQDLPKAYAWYQAQYDANRDPEAKRRADFVRSFLKPEQLSEAEKIKGEIVIPSQQVTGVN